HVEVQVAVDARTVREGELVDVVPGADHAQLLGAPPGEPQMRGGPVGGPGDGEGGLQDGRGAGAVVVDPGPGADAVEVGARHHDAVRVAAGPVGDQVVAGAPGGGELLEAGGVSGRVQLALHVGEGRLVAGAAVGAVAAVGGGYGLQLGQVGLDAGHGYVGCGGGARGGGGTGRRGPAGQQGDGGDGTGRRRTDGNGELHVGAPNSSGEPVGRPQASPGCGGAWMVNLKLTLRQERYQDTRSRISEASGPSGSRVCARGSPQGRGRDEGG